MKFFIKRKPFALIIGFTAFFLVFLLNIKINLFFTAVVRSIIAFLIFFTLGFIFHVIINYQGKPDLNKTNKNKIDLAAGNNDESLDLNEIYQTSKEEEFEPLNFTQDK